MIKAFPKIFHIGRDYIDTIFLNDVEITEKVDGSQFVFGKSGGDVFCRSKRQMLGGDIPGMFREGYDYIQSISDRIPEGRAFYCEYLQKPKHNTLKYDKIPLNHLVLFGSSTIGLGDWARWHTLTGWADALDIDVVPVLFEGPAHHWGTKELDALLDRQSFLGGTSIEGIVVKNYERPVAIGGEFIPVMSGKYVSEAFKEQHQKTWKAEKTPGGQWGGFVESFQTEARWEKAYQHLRDDGELLHDPKDIGKLIREIQSDIASEHEDEIRDFLWKIYGKELLKASGRGAAEWYKRKLAERAFAAEEVDLGGLIGNTLGCNQ